MLLSLATRVLGNLLPSFAGHSYSNASPATCTQTKTSGVRWQHGLLWRHPELQACATGPSDALERVAFIYETTNQSVPWGGCLCWLRAMFSNCVSEHKPHAVRCLQVGASGDAKKSQAANLLPVLDINTQRKERGQRLLISEVPMDMLPKVAVVGVHHGSLSKCSLLYLPITYNYAPAPGLPSSPLQPKFLCVIVQP
jgi:hypothetical protein